MIHSPPSKLASLATNRKQSLFAPDLEKFTGPLRQRITGRRLLVIGGAGSIGAATVNALVPFKPACLHIVDQSENSLVELVRDLRSRFDSTQLSDFRTLPLPFASPMMEQFLRHEQPYDHVLNFAALKHVRSEKDWYCILQMLDTNVLKPARLLRWLEDRGGLRGYFSVSTDKAANPVNLMGASKRLMEQAMFSRTSANGASPQMTSARFANVAFSDGSLLQGWLLRLSHGQPLAVPRDTRRYFISPEEAGQICVLAAFLGPDRHLLVPRLDPSKDLVDLAQLAVKVLYHFGYSPEYFEDEAVARRAASDGLLKERYPLLVTPLDTSGEKPFEEFVGDDEQSIEIGMQELLAVPFRPVQSKLLSALLSRLETFIDSADQEIQTDQLIREIQNVLPEFHHQSSTHTLDQRL